MDAIIFAAGKGKRLRPHTETTPKPLLQVTATKKIIDYVLDALPDTITRVIFVVDHLKEQIQEYVSQKNINKEIIFIQQEEIKGTYGALLSAKPLIASERFLILSADDIVEKNDLTILVQEKRAMGVNKKIMPLYYAIETDDDGFFVKFRPQNKGEKSNGTNIATGSYVLDKNIFNLPPVEIHDGEFGLPQMFIANAEKYPIKVVEMKTWYPVNNLADWEYAKEKARA